MSEKLSIEDLDISGKRVLIRVDFNVPQDKEGQITDDTRIRAAIPSLRYILDRGASAVIMSHLGRPKGNRNEAMSLSPCATRLQELLGCPVQMAPDCIGAETEALSAALKPGQVLLLENLRFHAAEQKPEKDPSFAQKLSTHGDAYINDAFGTAHRAHSSTAKITQYFPDQAAYGFLLEKEINFLGKHLLEPQKPFCAIIGGAKVSSKIGVIRSLLDKVDTLMIVGGMAYTFLKAQSIEVGDSLCEESHIETAREIMSACQEKNVELLLPQDFIIADAFDNNANTKIIQAKDGIPQTWQGLDIGPQSLSFLQDKLEQAKLIFWNGPAGVFEMSSFATGTFELAKSLAKSSAITIVGGGDSAAAIQQSGLEQQIDHLSTGGGACLEYIEFGSLPGIEALSKKRSAKSLS